MNKEINSKIAIIILVVFAALLIVWMLYEYQTLSFLSPSVSQNLFKPFIKTPASTPAKIDFKKFSQEEEFKNYFKI